MSKKMVTFEQMLDSHRTAEAKIERLKEEVAEQLAKRPTEEEVADMIGDIEAALAAI